MHTQGGGPKLMNKEGRTKHIIWGDEPNALKGANKRNARTKVWTDERTEGHTKIRIEVVPT